jgi:anti-anti-sigma factor
MITHVDEPVFPPAVATGAASMTEAAADVHPATRVNAEHSPLSAFEVIANPAAGRLELLGELDLACGHRFRYASAAFLAGGAAEVIVDLTRLRFIDTSGIDTLIEFGKELALRKATLRIVNADARIRRVFSLGGLEAMLAVPVPLAS